MGNAPSQCSTVGSTDNFIGKNMADVLRLTVGSSAENVECRDELITNILSRVSTTDLLKMCAVVKRWRNLIFDPGFAHTQHHNCHKQSMFIFSEEIRVPIGPKTPWPKHYIYTCSHNFEMDDLSILPVSLESPNFDILENKVIASNGLLCLKVWAPSSLGFLFYNPVTKFVKNLTLPSDVIKGGLGFPRFFGFCSVQNTKKLVIGGCCVGSETYTLVFDSQSDLWYRGPPPFRSTTGHFNQLGNPLFFKGVIYFLFRTPGICTQEGEDPGNVGAFFRDEHGNYYMIKGYAVNQDQWCFSVFIPTSVGYPYCLIEWDGKLLVLASNSTHEDNLFALAASTANNRKRRIRYSLNEGDGRFVFWILGTEHKLWTRERELDLSHEFHIHWRASESGGVVWFTSGYNSVVVYHMRNGHCSSHRLDALPWRKQTKISVSLEPTLLSF